MLNILKIVWEDGAEDFLNMNPKGDVLPCHAETIPHLKFDNVRKRVLNGFGRILKLLTFIEEQIGCLTHARLVIEEIDWGGCRCQAMALTSDAKNTDPAFFISLHQEIFSIAEEAKGLLQNSYIEDMVLDLIRNLILKIIAI